MPDHTDCCRDDKEGKERPEYVARQVSGDRPSGKTPEDCGTTHQYCCLPVHCPAAVVAECRADHRRNHYGEGSSECEPGGKCSVNPTSRIEPVLDGCHQEPATDPEETGSGSCSNPGDDKADKIHDRVHRLTKSAAELLRPGYQ